MTSPTQLTLKRLRAAGYQAAVVEKFNHHVGVRQDVWGFDIVAVRPDKPGTLWVQCTTVSNQAARMKKLLGLLTTRPLLAAGNRASVWGWVKREGRWQVTIREIRLEDCRETAEAEEEPSAPGGADALFE